VTTDTKHDRRVAERRFRGLLEAAPDAMVIVDVAGEIQLVNAQTERLFGHTRQELVGLPVEVIVPERFRGGHRLHREWYATAPCPRAMGVGRELYALHQDGREFPVEISLSPLESTTGLLLVAAIRDVTDRKRAEAELTRLYEKQRHVALTLQRSLMGTPPEIPGIRTASRYRPATEGAGVGGDWFDLVPLPDGQVGLLIGDVMGRGLEAAAVMGQLRAAARALAKTGMPPGLLMRALDGFVADLPDQLVTCCYLMIDPVLAQATVCSAGHPPALVAGPDGAVRQVATSVGVPLGVGGIPYVQTAFRIPCGSTLVLYTDGLVETPHSDLELQIEALAAELERALACEPGLESVAERLLAALLPASEASDDVTLLLARFAA
jgi:PAS domain S-box-containing protein